MTIKEMRERRGKCAEEMKQLADKIAKPNDEHEVKFKALDAEQEELRVKIEAQERSEKLEQELRTSRKPGEPPINQEDPTVADKEKREKRARAFKSYLLGRVPEEDRAAIEEMRDMGTGGSGAGIATSGGGIFVPVGFEDHVTEALKYYGPMLDGGMGMPSIMDTATGQILPFPTDNDTTNVGELIGEGQQVGMQDVSIASINLGAWQFSSKLVKVSFQLLQDSAFDIESYLVRKFATRLGRILNTKFTVGVGTTEPSGIITGATSGGTAVGAGSNDGVSGANTIGSDDLVTLEHSVDPLYRRKAKFMMHDSVLASIKRVKDKYGRMLWMPGLAADTPDTINGYGYLINNDMATLQTQQGSPPVTNKVVLFGDLPSYQIRRVKQMSVLRLNERFADFGQVAFIAFARYDGALLDAGTHPVKYIQTVY